MADGFEKAVDEAKKVLPEAERERLAEEIMKAVQAERMRKRDALLDWITRDNPFKGAGPQLREFHQEFKQDFVFPSEREEAAE